MPRRILIDGVTHVFPDGTSDDEIAAALGGTEQPSPVNASANPAATSPSVIVGATRAALPGIRQAAEEVATHPGVVSAATRVGQVAGGIGGIAKAGPLGMHSGARYGGIAGRLAGQATQKAAGVMAGALERAAPYTQALSTLSGAQGVLDLAQMAEPNRGDIGVLGVSIGKSRSDAEKAAHPALINQILQRLLAAGR
jgi:hypothetical protein